MENIVELQNCAKQMSFNLELLYEVSLLGLLLYRAHACNASHGTGTRNPSVRPSVHQTCELWQNERKFCPYCYII